MCWALDERDVVGVFIEVCIEVCIGGVKHAPFHEFPTPNEWKDPCAALLLASELPCKLCMLTPNALSPETTATPIAYSTPSPRP